MTEPALRSAGFPAVSHDTASWLNVCWTALTTWVYLPKNCAMCMARSSSTYIRWQREFLLKLIFDKKSDDENNICKSPVLPLYCWGHELPEAGWGRNQLIQRYYPLIGSLGAIIVSWMKIFCPNKLAHSLPNWKILPKKI